MQLRIGIENNIERYEELLKSKPKQRAMRKKHLKACQKLYREQKKEEGRAAPPILTFFQQKELVGDMMRKLL